MNLKNFRKFFDARDIFVFVGLLFLYVGIAGEFDFYVGLIVIGGIISAKGLIKWV
jgi:hypothetical protein